MLVAKYLFLLAMASSSCGSKVKTRHKRFLLTPTSSQYGVFVTVSIPIEDGSLVSLGWFMEASYYPVANATYWTPLYDDVEVPSKRQTRDDHNVKRFTREAIYLSIEKFLIRHGFPGRDCLLRSVCEAAHDHLHHNGLVGDLLHVVLTPSSSEAEDLDDEFYEAEYLGLTGSCHYFQEDCPHNPLEYISMLL